MELLTDTVAIILHWGNPERTKGMLERFRRAYPKPDHPRVLVVENGPPTLATDAYGVDDVRLPKNVGYGVGNNVGIRRALADGAEFVVLLNNDIGIRPGILEAMRAKARSPGVGLVGAVIQEMGRQVYGGGRVSWFRLRATLVADPVPPKTLHYIHGACLGIMRPCLERVGLLREDFFLYWEDTEYGLRARRAGFRCAVVEHPFVLHAGSASLGDQALQKTYYLVRNALYGIDLHGALPARLWARAVHPWRRWNASRRGNVAVRRALDDARQGVVGPAPEAFSC